MSKARPGRPRATFGERKPCGRLKTPSRTERAAMEARLVQAREALADPTICPDPDEAVLVALRQPHRRDARDPRDSRLSCALGRFCAEQCLPEPYWRGGRSYGLLAWRFGAGKKIPGVYLEKNPERELLLAPPTVEETGQWLGKMAERLDHIEVELRKLSPHWPDERLDRQVVIATRLLAWDELPGGLDLPLRMHAHAIMGLEFLASEFDHVEKSPHPYRT